MSELKILVVDDESRMRKLVKDFLTRAGYQVLEAQDGEEAVDTFYSTKGINLLVLDVMMPKMSVTHKYTELTRSFSWRRFSD